MLDRRLLIVTGKGGAGRSAVAVALALRAATAGRRVLAVGMTDGAGLAAHLGVSRLHYRPVEAGRGVWASQIERAAALDEYLRLQLRMPRVAPLGPLARMLSLFADTVPGIRDIITVGKVVFEADGGDWDLVVADGPPTGQIASYLRAPATIADLVPAGRVREQAGWMAGMLADAAIAGLVVVTLAEELPVTEAAGTLRQLDEDPLIDVAAVVVNRVLDPLDLGDTRPADIPPGPHREAALLHEGLVESQRTWMDHLPTGPRLPYLFGIHTPGEVAARLAERWDVE